jgi:hypothetical protein
MKKTPVYDVNRLPKRVRAHFPEAKTVSDANDSISIHVAPRDQKRATAQDPSACAMARACQRETKADGAWIGIGVSYILTGTHLTRYITPQSVAREIVSFDRHQDFAPGDYYLAKMYRTREHRMGAGKKGPSGKQDGSRPRSTNTVKRRHHTIGIRKTSLSA